MEFIPLKLNGAFEIRPTISQDSRGYFSEAFLRDEFTRNCGKVDWVQENLSFSVFKNTIRGLHFQMPPKTQSKLVTVSCGAILDVFVDLRKDSGTFGEWESVEIRAERCNSVFVPKGFAHGFCTLTDNVTVNYKVDELYSAADENGIIWNDPDLGIEWPTENPLLSERDRELGCFADFDSPF